MASKTVLVTGAGSGLGKALALRLAAAGSDVLICGRRAPLLAEVAALNKNIRTVVADVSTEEGCAAIKAELGESPLHTLVHNAGVFCSGSLGSVERERFRSVMAVNVEAPIFLTQKLAPNLRAAGGESRVLIIGSGAANIAPPTMGTYCISKAAVKHAWQCLKTDMDDVAAFGYCMPGFAESEMTGAMPGSPEFVLKDIIADRLKNDDFHTADEIAEWFEALLDPSKCPRDVFKDREHDVDNKEHQVGVQVRLTTEGKMQL